MTVKELISELMKQPMNAAVVVSSDAEGNDYNLLSDIGFGYWDQYDGYGEFHDEGQVTDPDFEWEPDEDSVRAVCLYPEG